MKALPIDNKKYGRLLVLHEAEPRIGKNGTKNRMLKCRCDCGNEIEVSLSHLKSGHTKSCGCLQKERASFASKKDLSGEKFGRLKVIERISETGEPSVYKCICSCGNFINVSGCNLKTGNTISCGCFRKEITSRLNYKHGLANSRIYQTYENMKKRCYDIKNTHYKSYGGKGIKICDEWLDDFMNFYTWAMANGYKDDLTIDRIDNDGNYEPSNCRWITRGENSSKRNNEYWKDIRKKKNLAIARESEGKEEQEVRN